MNTEVIEKEFNIRGNAYLSLSNIRGKVTIRAGEGQIIKVHAEKMLDSGDAENTLIELVQENEGQVVVRTRFKQSGFRFFRRFVPCRVNYEVLVPEKCDLKVRGVSNTARIDGISGKLDISTVSGDLNLTALEGEIKIKSVSGDVLGESIQAPARVDTVSGDCHLKISDFPSLRAKTVSGDLTIESPVGVGPYEFNSVSGDVNFAASQMSGVSLNSSSLSGELRTPLPLSSSNHSRNHRRAEVMGGGVEMRHKSVSGDFYFSGDGEPDDLDELPSPTTGQFKTLSHSEILERLERGELSVDQAVGMIAESNPS